MSLAELFVYPNQPQKAEKIYAVNTGISHFYYMKVEFCSLQMSQSHSYIKLLYLTAVLT